MSEKDRLELELQSIKLPPYVRAEAMELEGIPGVAIVKLCLRWWSPGRGLQERYAVTTAGYLQPAQQIIDHLWPKLLQKYDGEPT